MGFELISFTSGLIEGQAVSEVIKCNVYTERFGLRLTQAQAAELVETRSLSLRDNGRIEFGGGVIDKIIKAFCDSPFISAYDYAETLHELIEIFYIYKNETHDLIGDDDLIKFMKTSFDGVCQGSLDLLSGRELYRLAKNLRFGRGGYMDGLLKGQTFSAFDTTGSANFSEDDDADGDSSEENDEEEFYE
ncbi:MAG: DUF6323 family protein [Clostridiales bacterium]|jgi:hypothetical protein|nr:DUF6323 family protein [Clostridiales bacterium]